MKQGVISIQNGNFNDTNSGYWNNRASYGGVYYFKDAITNIKGITAFNNSAQYGGAVYAEDSTNVDAQDSIFTKNYASLAGGTFAVIRSTLTRTLNSISLNNCTIEESFCEA